MSTVSVPSRGRQVAILECCKLFEIVLLDQFPTPLEVDRQLYISYTSTFNYRTCTFPTPYKVTSPSLSLRCDSLMFLNTANLAIFYKI